MKSVQLKYIMQDRDRHGNVRWYFRRPGNGKIRLPCGPDSPKFTAAYEAALRSEPIAKDEPSLLKAQPNYGGLGFVYFMVAGDFVKIGYSADPLARAAGVQTGSAQKITSIIAIRGTVADERKLHRTFKVYRVSGEWFRKTPPIISAMARAAAYGQTNEGRKCPTGPDGSVPIIVPPINIQ